MLNQPILLALAIFVAAGSLANRWVHTARQAMACLLPLLAMIGWSFFNFYGGRLNLTLVLSAFYAATATAGIVVALVLKFMFSSRTDEGPGLNSSVPQSTTFPRSGPESSTMPRD